MKDVYLYTPEICDGDYCPLNCDYCSKRFEAELAQERWGKDDEDGEDDYNS